MILSLGSVDLAKRNAIVKELPSVETLGFTSAINSDKTGTLTMNQMTVVEVVDPGDRYTVSGTGYSLEGRIHHAVGTSASIEDAILPYVVASDAELVDGRVVGDPTEGALLVLAHKAGLDIEATRERLPRLATLPFDPTYKLMATFHATTGADGRPVVRCFVKGAAPAVMARAATALSADGPVPWDAGLQERAQAARGADGAGRTTRHGRGRCATWTRPSSTPTATCSRYVTDLQMTSLVGMVDPPRAESKAAVASAQAAHIRVRMVTGDDVITGAAIAEQLGIPGEAILGEEFAALPEDERLARIDGIGVVGRVAPEHKVLLVDTLKKKGDVVAMTGDGVNDAPAIHAADIGIAMGSGTDVAKNAGRMILSDDDFATIVFAVEQGRKIYDNLTKYIRFVLILLVVFVLTFLGATLFNIAAGEPFTPAQVLWIHFFVNAAFGLALGFDKETPGLMRTRPRPRGRVSADARRSSSPWASPAWRSPSVCSCCSRSAPTHSAASRWRGRWRSRPSRCASSWPRSSAAARRRRVLTTATFDSKQMNWTLLGRVRAGGPRHPDGRLQPTAGHDTDHPGPIRLGAGARPGPAGAVGTGQARRPEGRCRAPRIVGRPSVGTAAVRATGGSHDPIPAAGHDEGRVPVGTRPFVPVGDTGIEPVTSSV